MAAERGRPRLRRVVDGTRRRAGRVRQLDRAAARGVDNKPADFATCGSIENAAASGDCDGQQTASEVIRQHLIDPEICIRCNTCEETCPVDAVTHDARNYVVDATKCNGCNECIAPCPTGAIDNWRSVARSERVHAGAATLVGHACRRSRRPTRTTASSLPTDVVRITALATVGPRRHCGPALVGRASVRQSLHDREAGDRDRHRQLPPDRRRRVAATSGTSCSISAAPRFRCSKARRSASFLPAIDAQGRPHHLRLYSVASPREGERPALQQPRADSEARDRGSRPASPWRASHRTSCATSRKATR